MKKRSYEKILFLSFCNYCFFQLNAQDYYVLGNDKFVYKSSDSLNEKPENTFAFGGYVKLNVIYDFVGLSNITALNIPEMPVGKQFK